MSQSDNKNKTEAGKRLSRGGDRRRSGAATGDGPPMLRWSPNGSNYTAFKKAFATHVEGLHGYDATFLDTYKRGVWPKPRWAEFKPERPEAPVTMGRQEEKGERDDTDEVRTEPENTAADEDIEMVLAKDAYRDALRDYSKCLARQKATEFKIYGLITERLSAESLDRIKSHEAYEEIHEHRDAIKLWLLIRETHKVGAESSTKSMSKRKIRMAFFGMKQGQHESLVGYKERFMNAKERCEESEGMRYEDADVASQFYNGLCESRYGGFKKHLENAYAVDNATEPENLQEMYDRVSRYALANHRPMRSHGASTVFATTSPWAEYATIGPVTSPYPRSSRRAVPASRRRSLSALRASVREKVMSWRVVPDTTSDPMDRTKWSSISGWSPAPLNSESDTVTVMLKSSSGLGRGRLLRPRRCRRAGTGRPCPPGSAT